MYLVVCLIINNFNLTFTFYSTFTKMSTLTVQSFFIHQDFSIEFILSNNTNATLSQAQVYEILSSIQETESETFEENDEEDDLSGQE